MALEFIIRNITNNKALVIFNTKIGSGSERDLLKIPGVTPNVIQESLLTGELKRKFDYGQILLVKSTIPFPEIDVDYFNHLVNIQANPTLLSDTAVQNTSVAQPFWKIDPISGSDSNPGTNILPLKTFQEWQRRVGHGSILIPDGQLLIEISSDLNEGDYISFYGNIIGTGCSVMIQGDATVIESGTLSATQDKNPASNIPYTGTNVSAPAANYWTTFIGMKIVIPAKHISAWVLRDLGSKKAHFSTWVDDTALNLDGTVAPGETAAPGDNFEIHKYPSVLQGRMVFGSEYHSAAPPNFGGLLLNQLTLNNDPLDYSIGWMTCDNNSDIPCAYANCLFNAKIQSDVGDNNMAGNCLFRGTVDNLVGSIFLQTCGAYLPFPDTSYPGALRNDGTYICDGDIAFVGTYTNDFNFADFQNNGQAVTGQMNFWDTNHSAFCLPGATIWVQAFTPFYGESSYVPLYGTNNRQSFFYNDSSLLIEQFLEFGATELLLPTITYTASTVANMPGIGFGGNDDHNKAVSYNQHATPPAFTTAQDITWANFNVAIPNGFKVATTTFVGDGSKAVYSVALNPAAGAKIIMGNFISGSGS